MCYNKEYKQKKNIRDLLTPEQLSDVSSHCQRAHLSSLIFYSSWLSGQADSEGFDQRILRQTSPVAVRYIYRYILWSKQINL